MTTYPRSQLDDGRTILALAGSFWSRVYAASSQLAAMCGDLGHQGDRAHDDLIETADCLSRDLVPIHHRDSWQAITVRRSTTSSTFEVARFGGGLLFDGAAAYGEALPAITHNFAAVDVADIAWIFNRITDPSKSLCAGVDFVLDVQTGTIKLREDPFADPAWPQRPIYGDDGTVIDSEITMWLFEPGADRHYIHDRYGFLLGFDEPSSHSYRDAVSAVLDCVVQGSSSTRVERVLSAMTGAPLCGSDGEIVLTIGTDSHGPLVITNREAYRLPRGSTITVAVGARLAKGAQLCDSFEISALNRGITPPALASLAIGAGILGVGYVSDLTFRDAVVPLDVESDGDGITKVSFELGGFPADVRVFWDHVHARGVSSGTTLARLLDIRGLGASSEPTAASLPATINPLQFLIANLLRSNSIFVLIRAGAIAEDAVGLNPSRLLRRVMPPHVALIVRVEMPTLSDSDTISDDVGPDSYTPMDELAEVIVADPLWDGPPTVMSLPRSC